MSQTLLEREREIAEFEGRGMWTHEEMKTKMNMVHCIDALEFMKRVPDGYFDLVLTDPPYGIGAGSDVCGHRHKGNKKEWDNKPITKEYLDEIIRISEFQIIWGGNYFELSPHKCFLIWDKGGSLDMTLAMAEMAWTNIDYPAKMYRHHPAVGKTGNHPTEKPLKVIEFCMEFIRSRHNIKTVFDPFMGSGTTAVACKSLELEWCGCELEPDYVEIANKRLKAVQTSIFSLDGVS